MKKQKQEVALVIEAAGFETVDEDAAGDWTGRAMRRKGDRESTAAVRG